MVFNYTIDITQPELGYLVGPKLGLQLTSGQFNGTIQTGLDPLGGSIDMIGQYQENG